MGDSRETSYDLCMETKTFQDNLLMALIVLVTVLLVAMAASTVRPSRADGQDRRRVSPALALARICVSEASLPTRDAEGVWVSQRRGVSWGRDCWAIHEVLLRGAHHHDMSYVAFARSYSSSCFGSTRWVSDLWPEAQEPHGWPRTTSQRNGNRVRLSAHPPWSSYRAAWQHAMALTQHIVTETLETVSTWSVCEAPPDDWGGSMDRLRAQRLGLVPVSCGDTANDFYRRPSRMVD